MNNLKEEIELKFGRRILTRGDCEALAQLVEMKTGEVISYNTIRRFFSLEKKKYKTRTSTLDVFSKFIGFDSYNMFLIGIPTRRMWPNRQLNYEILNTYDQYVILSHFNSIKNESNLLIEFLILFVRHYLLKRKVNELLSILELADLNADRFSYIELLYIGNSVGLVMRNDNLSKAHLQKLVKSNFFNFFVFEIFVDYSSLNKFYSVFINSKSLNANQSAFKTSLKCLVSYLDNQKVKEVDVISIYNPSFHPILRGRIATLSALIGENYDSWNYSLFETKEDLEFYYEPMVVAIITGSKELHQLIANKIKGKLKLLEHYHIQYVQVYYLFKAFFNYKADNLAESLRYFDQLQLDKFRSSYKELLSFFYYLVGWRLKNDDVFKIQAEYFSEKLNYKRFDKCYIDVF